MKSILLATVYIIVAVVILVFYYYLKPKKIQRFESLYTDALNAIVRGDSKTALTLLRQVVRQDTDHINAYLQMGEILREQGQAQQALKIHKSLTVRPNLTEEQQFEVHRSMAMDYMSLDMIDKAKQEAEIILKLEKKNPWAMQLLLEIAEKERNWVKAAQVAKDIQKITQQKNPSVLAQFQVYEGMDKISKDDRKGAEKCFFRALEIDPQFGQAHFRLGNLYEEDRDLLKAIEHWEIYATMEPENAKSIFTKVETALFDLGRYSEVEKFYNRILEKTPANLDALARMANVLVEKGERQQALNLIDSVMEKFDKSIHARLMKLKTSLTIAPPHELSRQIDKIIELYSSENEV